MQSAGKKLPVLCLLFCALVGGTGWWPFRALQAAGLHPLWATVVVYVAGMAVLAARHPAALSRMFGSASLWLLALAFGTMNATFFWAVAIGDVVRVVLLFYLMPLWAVILARLLLHEPVTLAGIAGMVVSVAGAFLVLSEGNSRDVAFQMPLPSSLADWLGLAGGFAFALNNVLLRRDKTNDESSQMMAMFFGCVLVAGVVATGLAAMAVVPWLPGPAIGWLSIAGALSIWFLLGNFCLQFGAARLPSRITSIVMLSEIVFAAVSAAMLGNGQLTSRVIAGGVLIFTAAGLAAWHDDTPGADSTTARPAA